MGFTDRPARRLNVTRYRVPLWMLLFLLPFPLVQATGLNTVLKNSPFASFTDSDYKQFFASAKQAAEGPVGGDVIEWSNTDTGARGTVKSTRAFHREEGDCRRQRHGGDGRDLRAAPRLADDRRAGRAGIDGKGPQQAGDDRARANAGEIPADILPLLPLGGKGPCHGGRLHDADHGDDEHQRQQAAQPVVGRQRG
jgi:hypothetical protein